MKKVIMLESGYKTVEEGRKDGEALTFWSLEERVEYYLNNKNVCDIHFLNNGGHNFAYIILQEEK